MSNDIFSYTNRSLEASRTEGMNKIPIISRGDWTDLNPTDPGMILLDYVHSLVDMIQFYQDHNALETFISTAKERKNIFRIAKQLCYSISSAKGSRVDVKFYLRVLYNSTVKIPKNTRIFTETGIPFLTTEDAFIPAGSLEVLVPCVQGSVKVEYYTGTGLSRYSNVENPKNQSYRLMSDNVDTDSIQVVDTLNNLWSPVDSIIFSASNDKVYQRVLNPDGSVDLLFGDGQRGVIPTTSDELIVQYLYSMAEEGRTGANTIVHIGENIFDILGNKVDVYVTNPESTSGGSGPQSEEEITEKAPGVIKSQNRAVTLSDFENLAKMIDGVADAKAYDINTAPDMCLYHEVKVVVIPDIGTTANSSLLKGVFNYLSQRMIPPTNLQVLAPSDVLVNINVEVIRNPSYLEGGIEYSIKEAIENYFNGRNTLIGHDFNPNEIISVVSTVPGVRYVSSISPSTSIQVSNLSIIKLGTLNISVT